MVRGIGTDILAYKRIRPALAEESFLKAVYTEAERKEAESRPDSYRYYFSRFAGKEAVFKALGIHPDGIRLKEIEILTAETGAPVVRLDGETRRRAEEKQIREVLLSLSWEEEYAAAYALAQ